MTIDEADDVRLEVDYPTQPLDRVSTALRFLYIIPIAIILGLVSNGWDSVPRNSGHEARVQVIHELRDLGVVIPPDVEARVHDPRVDAGGGGGGGAAAGVCVATALMLVVRRRYPRWWFEFVRELAKLSARVGAYAALLTDRYPSTEDEQAVHVHLPVPDTSKLSRWLPLVKWFLAIPHYIILAVLGFGAVVAVIVAWFAILFTGRYPRALFDYVVGVGQWALRVQAYAFLLVTDKYPPFTLETSTFQPAPA